MTFYITEIFFILLYGSVGKESACNSGVTGDMGSTPESRRSPEKGNGNLLQYSGWENAMGCIVHGISKSQTRLSDFHFI